MKTYIRKSYFNGKCEVCGSTKDKDGFIKEFKKVNIFREDDEELHCWCPDCYQLLKENK